jgi:hypothetical protein
MRGMKRFVAGVVLSASFLMADGVRAMPLPQFDQMTTNQKGDYTEFLIRMTMDIFNAQGDTADAQKVLSLFGQQAVISQYVENVNAVRKVNRDNAGDPTFKPFEIEHAFCLTLKENKIILPVSKLLIATKDYKPAPPSGNAAGKSSPAPAGHP